MELVYAAGRSNVELYPETPGVMMLLRMNMDMDMDLIPWV